MHLDENDNAGSFNSLTPEIIETEINPVLYMLKSSSALAAIKRSIDSFYQNLGDTLPEINLEIYKTYKKASVTLDSLRAEGTSGKIDNTVSSISAVLISAVAHVNSILDQDKRILAALLGFGAEIRTIDRGIGVLGADDSGMTARINGLWEEIKSLHGSLVDPMKKIVEMEQDMIDEISGHIDNDIQSLNNTLNSIALILNDLIKRSDATKRPILDIMTRLQIHDILSQDLGNIISGLDLLRQCSFDFADFNKIAIRFGFLSGNIVNEIARILQDQIDSIKAEIEKIKNIILHEREDKLCLTEFLLESKERGSTFDAVITEVAELLAHILNKLEYLAASKWLVPGYLSSMIEKIEIIEGLCNQYATIRAEGDTITVSRALSEMIRLQSDIDFYKLEELKKFIQEMEEILLKTMEDLGIIKDLMLDSTAGIDAYSGRCMECIDKFIAYLDDSSHVHDECEQFSRHLRNNVGDPGINEMATEGLSAVGSGLLEVLKRLEHPHILTMKSPGDENFDEVTLF